MTREEAIIILSARSRILKNSKKTGKQHAAEALDMAIEALSQPERPKGRWESIRNAYGDVEGWICTCGREVKCKDNYCPNCGADMGSSRIVKGA